MQTVLLAAGQGTRIRPLSDRRPKPMLPVGDRPLLARTADAAVEAGASRLILVVGYEADAVRSYFGDRYGGVPVSYVVQDEQLGTAHAVRTARPELEDAPFAVLNGDDIYDASSLQAVYQQVPAVGAYRVDDARPYGVFEVDGDRVTAVVEKPADPPSNRINVGAYTFPAEAQDWLDVPKSDRGEYEITDVLSRVITESRVTACDLDRWIPVGRPWELLDATEFVLSDVDASLEGEIHPDANVRGPVVVEAGARIDAGVVVEGPVYIESGVTVGPNAYVRPSTVLKAGVSVGHSVEIKNSILMEGATVGHLAYVGDSILGRDVNFGAGTTVANLRHDDASIVMRVNGDAVVTGRRKLGVVCGDDVKTGINTSLNPGLVLGTEAVTYPGEAVTEDRGRD
jgi:UDP-N-acetylglucosamine diphosphorylase/glucosamine-1-phosphate N-acetyltransferase